MKTWIIASIIFGLLIVGGIAVNAVSNDSVEIPETGSPSCTSCGNGCSAENNCGLATCGAVSGTGSCGCGNK